MEVNLLADIELDNAFLKELIKIRELVSEIGGGESLKFTTLGPIRVTIETNEIVKKYARENNIITTKKGIGFVIQDQYDPEMIIKKIQDLNRDLMLHERSKL